MADEYPYITELSLEVSHDDETTLDGWDDQVQFEFGLDLILDGLDSLRETGEQFAAGEGKVQSIAPIVHSVEIDRGPH